MIIELHKAFKGITYSDSNHTYEGSAGQSLTSVTQFIKKHQPKFDSDYFALNTALKESGFSVKTDKAKNKKFYIVEGQEISIEEAKQLNLSITPGQIKKRWSKSGMIGSSRGNIVHKYIEDYLANKIFPLNYPNVINTLPADEFIDFHNTIDICKNQVHDFIKENHNLIPIKSEVIVGDEELGIAGTVDQIFFDTNTNKYHLYDWKTDKKIDKSNYYSQMLPPLAHLDSCRYIKYSLQVNGLYRHIIEKNLNIELGDSYVVWFNAKNKSYQIIKLMDLKEEINALFYNREIFEI